MKCNKPKFVLSLKTKEAPTFKGLLITQNQEWDSFYFTFPNMQCKEMKQPLSPQLAVIISNISPIFPPGKPETTNNKGQTFLQIQHFLLMLEPDYL